MYELEDVINELPLRNEIRLDNYFRFSEVMQKIMYEYGCYDDVYELTGQYANDIRSGLKFPKTGTPNNHYPFFTQQKLYYIDLNGAYMSCVESIPTGIDFKSQNTKIKDLIEDLYQKRLEAKQNDNPKLATTIKFLMNSCWGYSIKRPQVLKNKYVKSLQTYIDQHEPFILSYKFNNDNVSGYCTLINPFVQHYTIPHFAKSVLDSYYSKFNEIKSLVNPIYENVDALLLTESDYKILEDKGYMHPTKLGYFKSNTSLQKSQLSHNVNMLLSLKMA